MQPKQIPNADSKNRNTRQTRQVSPVIMLYEFIITRRKNIKPANAIPIFQANFFCGAPTYSGFCLLTIKRPIINAGENFGLIKTRITRSVRKTIITYLISRKFPLNKISIKEISISTNNIPADALISRSFKTGIVYPSMSSPNFIHSFFFFILRFYRPGLFNSRKRQV